MSRNEVETPHEVHYICISAVASVEDMYHCGIIAPNSHVGRGPPLTPHCCSYHYRDQLLDGNMVVMQ